MSGLKRLIHEVHRRSLWQVLGIYLVGAWIGYEVIQSLTEGMGLPAWFPALAVVLFIIGLPVVLATAFVQEGVGARQPSGELETTTGGTPIPSKAVDEGAHHRIFTWRNAIGGGVVAFALWGVVATAWLFFGPEVGPRGAQPAAASGIDLPSIAVLPFADMSPEQDQEYFSDGISEELLNLLAKVPGLQVAARTSSFSFKGENVEIPEIAARLKVDHVLEGSVRKAGDQVRITAQLIRSDDGFHVWSESWDRSLEDIFAIQDEIAAEVVEQLKVTLLGGAPTVAETDPEAYALVLRARHLSEQRTAESMTRAEELFREALAIDPEYAPAWSGLAFNYFRQAGTWRPIQEALELAREAAKRALEIDPDHAPAHTLLGRIASGEGDLTTAARHHERALALDPGGAYTMGQAALILQALGRVEETITLEEWVVARDPVSGHLNLGLAYLGVGRWADAVESLRTAVELKPAAGGVQSFLGTAMLYTGEPEAALAVIEDEPVEPFRLIAASMAYHALGRTPESDSTLAELIEKYEQDAAYNIAYVVAYRGEIDRAFEWLDKAVTYEDPGLSEIFIRPEFEVLSDDPRWLPFLERIGKSPEQLAAIEFEVTLPK